MDNQARPSTDAAAPHTSDPPHLHNPATDEDVAKEGGCAQVHLPTGRLCTLRHGHAGSCEFIPAEAADASLAQRKADEGW